MMNFEFDFDNTEDIDTGLENDLDDNVQGHGSIFGGHDILDNGMKIGETHANIFGGIDMKK